jgi:hypothetical protein
LREAEVGLRSTDTIKFYFKKDFGGAFEREAFALKVGDRGTKNSLPGQGQIYASPGQITDIALEPGRLSPLNKSMGHVHQ